VLDNFKKNIGSTAMTTSGQRIKSRRMEKNLTQRALGELVGVSATSITYWENAEVEPKNKHLSALSRALDCAPDYILHGATFGGEVSIAPIHSRIPLIRWNEVNAYYQGDYMKLDKETVDWLYCPVQCGENTFATTVNGDSMTSPYPNNKSYPAGIIIFIDPDAPLVSGSRVMAKLEDSEEATFKEYIEDGGKKLLKPINPQYAIEAFTDGSIIIGVVIGSFVAE
jgi:SOS-response transcriptional repressor LexA